MYVCMSQFEIHFDLEIPFATKNHVLGFVNIQ